jgi:hypothetical protein
MQAALSSVISSGGAFLGVSSSVELSADDEELLAILEKKLERTGVAGTLLLAVFAGVFLDDETLFDDSVRDGFGLEDASFSFSFSLSFDDELLDFDLGDLCGSVLDRESFGGALSGNAPIGVDVLGDVGFEAAVFDDDAFGAGAATFAGAGFGAATFGDGGFAAAAFAGGAALGIVTLGGGAAFGGGG